MWSVDHCQNMHISVCSVSPHFLIDLCCALHPIQVSLTTGRLMPLFSTSHSLRLCSSASLHPCIHVIWIVSAPKQAGCPDRLGPVLGYAHPLRPFMYLQKRALKYDNMAPLCFYAENITQTPKRHSSNYRKSLTWVSSPAAYRIS